MTTSRPHGRSPLKGIMEDRTHMDGFGAPDSVLHADDGPVSPGSMIIKWIVWLFLRGVLCWGWIVVEGVVE